MEISSGRLGYSTNSTNSTNSTKFCRVLDKKIVEHSTARLCLMHNRLEEKMAIPVDTLYFEKELSALEESMTLTQLAHKWDIRESAGN